MKTYFTRDIRKIFFLVKHLKFLPFKYQNFVHVPQKYSDVQPHTILKLCYFVLREIKRTLLAGKAIKSDIQPPYGL